MTENQEKVMKVLEANIINTAPGTEENFKAVDGYVKFLHEINEPERMASSDKIAKRQNLVAIITTIAGVAGTFGALVLNGVIQAKGGIPLGEKRLTDNMVDTIQRPKIK